MLVNAVPEWICSETLELFHALVDCLMATAHSVLHAELGLISNKGTRTLAVLGALSNEAIISFHPFVFIQPIEKTPAQALDIVKVPRWERAFNADDLSSLDAKCDEMSEASFLELAAAQWFAVVSKAKINPINRCKTVVAFILTLSVFPNDLKMETEWQVGKLRQQRNESSNRDIKNSPPPAPNQQCDR